MLYQIIVYVPISHIETVKDALFEAGAGKYTDYDQCSWQSEGMGQFRPLLNANPFIGKIEQLEKVPEIKLEMICTQEVIKEALRALHESHPYEEPAYGVIELKTMEDFE